MKRLLITFFCLCSLLSIQAQRKYAVEIDNEKKILRVDSLHLSPNISVIELLKLLPELVERPGNALINNYDVQLEGLSLGSTVDAALHQLKIDDIDRIEVNESPISSYKHNGQGGSIMIFLRQKATSSKREHTWGSTSVSAAYPTDIMPQFLINYKNEKWLLRGVFLGENYSGSFDENIQTGTKTDQLHTDRHFLNEMARIYLTYQATPKDVLNLKLSESHTRDHQETSKDKLNNNRTYQAFFSWERQFSQSTKSTLELKYLNEPGEQDVKAAIKSYTLNNENHNSFLYERWRLKSKYKNANGNFLETEAGISAFEYHFQKEKNFKSTYSYDLETLNKSIFLMPYLQAEAKLGKIKVKGIVEYQYYKYDLTRESTDIPETFIRSMKDLTAKMILSWKLTPNRHLRLILDRKLDRPEDSQLFPYTIFEPTSDSYRVGNPDLSAVLSHEIGLNYISEHYWKEQSLIIDGGISYNMIDDIINRYFKEQDTSSSALNYFAYKNEGYNRLWNANLMAIYQKGAFTLSFSGNFSRNNKNVNGKKDHYSYYNLSLLPSLNLKNGWSGSLNLLYHSMVDTAFSDLGDCSYGLFTLGKSWGPVYVSVNSTINFTGKTTDTYYWTKQKTTYRTYDLVTSSIGAGIRYQF